MLAKLLEEQRTEILQQWVELILRAYPQDSAGFLRKEHDQFRNPVGHTISTDAEVLLAALIDDIDDDRLTKALDEIVRIRTVQDLSPAQAISFIFLLKTTVREVLAEQITQPAVFAELLEFESRVDGLALQAFNNYMQCKEAVYEIRAREARMQTAKLVEQVNRIYDQNLPTRPERTERKAK
ncbi:hypothetical protein GF377_10530 [candidate division GN15 bacterium]|nr:hypothetical protein [candidate division GN15 bacterium]